MNLGCDEKHRPLLAYIKEYMQKIVDANEKLVKELKDNEHSKL